MIALAEAVQRVKVVFNRRGEVCAFSPLGEFAGDPKAMEAAFADYVLAGMKVRGRLPVETGGAGGDTERAA